MTLSRRNQLAHRHGWRQRHSLLQFSWCHWTSSWNWFAYTFPVHWTASTIGRHISLCTKWPEWEIGYDFVRNALCQSTPSVWWHRRNFHKSSPAAFAFPSMASMWWWWCCCHCLSLRPDFVLDRKTHWNSNWCLVSSTIAFHFPVLLSGWGNGTIIHRPDYLFQPHCNLIWIGSDIFPSLHCSARKKREKNNLFISGARETTGHLQCIFF